MNGLQVLEVINLLLGVLRLAKSHNVSTEEVTKAFELAHSEDRDMTEAEVQVFIDDAQSAIDNARNT